MPHAVLVVEDSELIQELTLRFLERAGYTVFAAQGPFEAEYCFETNEIDVVLIDLQLGMKHNLNGLDLARSFRAKKPKLLIIICSGHDPEDIDCEGALFLQKPFAFDRLVNIIKYGLDNGGFGGIEHIRSTFP